MTLNLVKKIIKNKVIVLSVCIVIICILFLVAQKLIDNYEWKLFNSNEEVAEEIVEDIEKIEYGVDILEEIIDDEPEVNEEGEILKIFVHVAGEVNQPGVVTLDEGSRIIDAINAAGGFTDSADVSDINLAYLLKDGMKVNIPNKENIKEEDFVYVTDTYGNSTFNVANNLSSTDDGLTNSEESENSDEVLRVNINSATQTELESLPGIGPSIALKIINYRKEHGKFSSIDEIKNVSGIGDAKFEAIKEFIYH